MQIPELTLVVHLELDSGINACNFRTSSVSSSSVILVAPVLLLLDMPWLWFLYVAVSWNKSSELEADGRKNELLKKSRVLLGGIESRTLITIDWNIEIILQVPVVSICCSTWAKSLCNFSLLKRPCWLTSFTYLVSSTVQAIFLLQK